MLTSAPTHARTNDARPEAPGSENAQTNARLSLVTDASAVAPGTEFTLALRFAMRKDWHIYWNGRTDTGFAPSWELDLPAGWTASEAQWPAPHRYLSEGDILDHVYEERVLILVPIKVAADARVGNDATIRARAKWLVCSDACIPEKGDAQVSVRVEESAASNAEAAAEFANTRARLAPPLPADAGIVAKIEGDTLVIEAKDAAYLAFYPARESSLTPSLIEEGEAQREGATRAQGKDQSPVTPLALRIALEPHPDAPDDALHAKGVLEVRGMERSTPSQKQPAGEPSATFFTIDVRSASASAPSQARER